jgi:hypothetical protein
VCVAGGVYERVSGQTDHKFDDWGYRKLKTIGQPVRVHHARVIEASTDIINAHTHFHWWPNE